MKILRLFFYVYCILNVFLGTVSIVVWIVGCQETVRVCVENRVLHLKQRVI